MRVFLVSFLAFFISTVCINAQASLSSIKTLFVIVEERENNLYNEELQPVSDGFFESLWEKDMVFFDYQLPTPMTRIGELPDHEYYYDMSSATGADAYLLLIVKYRSEKNANGFDIVIDECSYTLNTVKSRELISKGKIELQQKSSVFNNTEKTKYLNRIGLQILNKIFK